MKKDMIFYCPKCRRLESNWEISYSEGKIWVACRASLGFRVKPGTPRQLIPDIEDKNCDWYGTIAEVREIIRKGLKME